ncbi:MAG: hypothetical protein DMF78_11745 [Acidobacteria bacterium]|nr:MAG: hypothetical protein DMF78_11745 [Acidobacteriota bacterium]
MSGVPVAVHEFVVAPAAFAIALWHGRAALGSRRALGELLALAAYGWALERVSMSVFASHRYGAGWRVAPLGVPVAVAMVWAAVIASALALAARRGLHCGHRQAGWLRPAAARSLGAALLAVTLDLAIEPVAIRRGLWHWTPPGPWLGVPVGNFVGWLVIVASYGLGAERWAGGGAFASEAARRLAVAAASLSALVAVGLVWTRLDLEQAVGRRGGWLFWAAVLLATAAVGVRRAPPFEGDTLSGRLASVPGPGPGLVFLVVATAFAAEAALLGERAVGLVALGSALALLPLLRLSGTASSGS